MYEISVGNHRIEAAELATREGRYQAARWLWVEVIAHARRVEDKLYGFMWRGFVYRKLADQASGNEAKHFFQNSVEDWEAALRLDPNYTPLLDMRSSEHFGVYRQPVNAKGLLRVHTSGTSIFVGYVALDNASGRLRVSTHPADGLAICASYYIKPFTLRALLPSASGDNFLSFVVGHQNCVGPTSCSLPELKLTRRGDRGNNRLNVRDDFVTYAWDGCPLAGNSASNQLKSVFKNFDNAGNWPTWFVLGKQGQNGQSRLFLSGHRSAQELHTDILKPDIRNQYSIEIDTFVAVDVYFESI